MSLAVAKRMWALDSPTLTVDAATLMYGLTGMITIPMPAFLIEHPKGLVLFDTGIAPEAIDDPESLYGAEMAAGLGIAGTADQRIDRQLAALGYKVSDVTHVVSSHLHFDHAGGHHLFPMAAHYVGQGELEFAHFPDPIGAFCYMPDQLQRTKNFDWRVVPGVDHDLFGDGSLIIYSMPGHTPGELSLKVRLASRTFILTGDAVHLRAALEQEYHFPIDHDTKSSLRTLRRLKRLRESEDATLWITHDPDDWAAYGHAPTCWE
ncbi:N-acyl homoserine lactonase family protein [Amycolatopsis sacchari]|uniref:N-acyl homoserine lactonase family protein n=1 Tax=Amycolatopsis sacchari TaxID=115433 RepID=UPI003EB9274C